jgi:hypothetical protein
MAKQPEIIKVVYLVATFTMMLGITLLARAVASLQVAQIGDGWTITGFFVAGTATIIGARHLFQLTRKWKIDYALKGVNVLSVPVSQARAVLLAGALIYSTLLAMFLSLVLKILVSDGISAAYAITGAVAVLSIVIGCRMYWVFIRHYPQNKLATLSIIALWVLAAASIIVPLATIVGLVHFVGVVRKISPDNYHDRGLIEGIMMMVALPAVGASIFLPRFTLSWIKFLLRLQDENP